MDIMIISTPYPGSSPKEVEKLITIPVERSIKEVFGIDEVHSVSIEGRSSVVVVIDEDLSAKDTEKCKTDIQRAIDRIEDLPDNVDKPNVHEVRAHQMRLIEINLMGLSEPELRRQADLLEDRLELISGISSIGKRGYREREFWVEVDPLILKEYHLSLSEIIGSLGSQNINLPGGTSTPNGEEFLVRTMGEVETSDQISNIVVRSNDLGNANLVKDVAHVTDTFEEETRIEKLRGKKSITLVLLKHKSADSIDLIRLVQKELEMFQKTAPKDLKIETSNDSSYYVQRRLNVLVNNGWMGMLLVLIAIFFFLSKRTAMITALGIPFAFCLTLIILKFIDININLISMFGLIIVSGMIVDDGIVFAENIFSHMQRGLKAHDAAIQGAKEVFKPVLATVITTIIAFLPLAFMKGTMGKFVWQIPTVVIIALLASLVEAVIILPVHAAEWVDPSKERLHTPNWLLRLRQKYIYALKWVIQKKFKVLGITAGVFALSLLIAFKGIDFKLFPPEGIEVFFIKAKANVGTPIEDMAQRMQALEAWISKLPEHELKTFNTQVGVMQKDINDPFTRRGSHVAQIMVELTPEAKRKRDANEIIRDLEEKTKNVQGFENIWFTKVTPGPPVGRPVSIDIRGDDFEELKKHAQTFKEALQKIEGVQDIEDSFEKGKQEIRLSVNSLKAAQAGISVQTIAQTVRSAFEGSIATTIRKADEEINVRVRLAKPFRDNTEVFDSIFIPNNRGNLIPLKEVVQIESGEGISYINHFNYKRTITVTATIDSKVTSSFRVNRQIRNQFKDFSQNNIGYDVKYGGEQKDTHKSLSSLGFSFIFAAIGIVFILCVVFQSLLQPLIVMVTVPLSIIGVVFAFFTHGYPFSFMAILGMVGLTGVVVNNAIILIDLMNKLRIAGEPLFDSVLKAAHNRFRPILLTSFTTILGLGPVAYGLGGDDPILRPTAMVITWGILFSSALTLFIVPALYLILYDLLARMKTIPWVQNTFGRFIPDIPKT